jgi:hypothetical protein
MPIVSVVSGYDDLFYDVTLTDESTDQPLTPQAAGTVSVSLCRINTTTPLGQTATQVLSSQGSGRWTGLHDDADVLAALNAGNVVIGQQFDLVLTIGSVAIRKLGTCQRVAIVSAA